MTKEEIDIEKLKESHLKSISLTLKKIHETLKDFLILAEDQSENTEN